ncbi:carbohydrate ABC transporter permease [Alicyclobacillus mali (ex Roth et al. 2021)]|uniref:carbohydrate ABC transporter permease n=1 Tax=Alicyclobacillus mali (ex Roth et al. 2021) TaxID=1123961 RepID=UPI001A8C64DC|nr:sugar ABC transporter permease [Alicyclobacillus mali (ex Roth et al. 2021)]
MTLKARRTFTAYMMLIPTLILVAVFTLYPILESFVISFFHWDMISPHKQFVGLQNYLQIFEDPLFHRAVINTLLFVILYVPIVMALGLAVALLLNARIRFRAFFRTAIFLPYVTSIAATGIIWQWIFNGQFGLLNDLLRQIGIQGPDWLNTPQDTMICLVTLSVWQSLGYVSVLFLAGLQNISREYYEAARVDGAHGWRLFRHVTWPLLSPTTFFVLLMSTIEAFKVFLPVYVLYGATDGPNDSGLTMLYYMFTEGFSDYRMGYASASAYILFVIILACTLLQMTLQRRVHYES